MPYRARYLRMAGALALASGSLFATGAPAVTAASIVIKPMMTTRFASATQPPSQAQCVAAFTVPCYEPAQLQTAYNEQPLFNHGITGAGQTIVLVDSFGSPTIQSDLATFDAQFNLPAPPSLKVIQPAGVVPPYDPTNSAMVSWAGETTLDVEWAHSMAPGANILLVETPVAETEGTAGFPEIVQAENYVINHHLGQVISQSLDATEGTFPNAASIYALRSAYINAYVHGVTVLAASGDTGATNYSNVAGTLFYTHPVVGWPASDPLVTGVGGTQLQLTTSGQRTAPDQVWNDTYNTALQQVFFGDAGPNPLAGGGGKSAVFSRPWYQTGVAGIVGNARGVPDIAMSGACSGLVDTYQSFGGERRLVRGLRHERGDPLVRRDRIPGRPGSGAFPRPDQPGVVHPVRRARTGPGRHHPGEQHGVVHPERNLLHGAGLQRPPRLRPGVGGGDGQRRPVRPRAGPGRRGQIARRGPAPVARPQGSRTYPGRSRLRSCVPPGT